MLLATILLLGAIPQSGQVAKAVVNAPVVLVAEASEARSLPSMPVPKAAMEADGVNSSVAASAAGADPVQPPRVALPIAPMKAAYIRPRETRQQRVAWYTLAVAGHGAAAFDAYSTRLVVSGKYGTESNPFLRPFANSSALYAVTQVSPVVMDYIGKRMMVSQNRLVRRMWWLPQAAGAGLSVGAGVHNMGIAK